MVAYGSLVVMALLPIFIGSYRSVSSHRLVFIGSYSSLVVSVTEPEPVLFGRSQSRCENVKAKTSFLRLFSLFLYEKKPEPVKKSTCSNTASGDGSSPHLHWFLPLCQLPQVSLHWLLSYVSLVVMALLPIALAPTAPLAPTGYFLSTPSPLSAPTG